MLLRFVLAGSLLTCGQALAANELIIKGNGISRHIPCNGADLDILGKGNNVTITGECRSIDIRGSDHTVRFEDVDDLDIEGSNSKVFGKEATSIDIDGYNHHVEVAIDGEDESGELDVDGARNKVRVELLSTVEIKVAGKDNTIEWSLAPEAQPPIINVKGKQNKVKQFAR